MGFTLPERVIPHIENKWVIFMGAGDTFFSKHTLSNIAPHLTSLEEAMLVYGKTTMVIKIQMNYRDKDK